MKKVLQLEFNGAWERGGCLSHIVRAWARNSSRYEQYFASWRGKGNNGEMEGRPNLGFEEDARANRVFNKILRWNRNCFFSLTPIIEEVRPDILHFHNRFDLVDQIVGSLSYRPKVVCIYHYMYNKLVIPKQADLLLGVGKVVLAWIDRKASPVQPMAVLHNPIWKVPAIERKARAKPLILNYANLPKATRDLFTAVEMLQAGGVDFDVRVVGHVYPELAVPKGVTVSAFIPQPEFLELAGQATGYLCTTYATPFSVAVLEAMARRTPVLCPWDIGALDVLPPDCVISYESHSAVAMAGALRSFLKMPDDQRAALAERALAAASVAYDEARLTERLEGLYDTLFV